MQIEVFQEKWQQLGFHEMTAVQQRLFDPITQGESLVAISPTGTGKTLAYLLPLLAKIEGSQELQLIILAPSQELVKQISEVAKEWAQVKSIRCQAILGSANIKRQLEALKNKPEVIVATPGRLLELAQQSKKVKFHQVKAIVFDEGDYLLEDEQEKAVSALTKRLVRDVQKIWVSATLSEVLQQMAISQGLSVYQEGAKQLDNLLHIAILSPDRQKLQQLKRLAQVEGMQAIVFFEQVHELESTAAKLLFDKVAVGVLHGQLSKIEREAAINRFRQGELTYLLTTDVAARGLDIADLPAVVHFNRVNDSRIYTHRSGRTGRMGKEGMVISLVNEQEYRDLQRLLMTEAIHLTEYVTYQGKLMLPEQRHALRVDQPERKVKPKAKIRKAPQNTPKIKKGKIKNRHRDTKNKGKRKPNK